MREAGTVLDFLHSVPSFSLQAVPSTCLQKTMDMGTAQVSKAGYELVAQPDH